MNDRRINAEAILFDYETTANTSYRDHNVKHIEQTVYGETTRATVSEPRDGNVNYVYTMMNWRNKPVPFDFMTGRKEIIRTNPHDAIHVYKQPADEDLVKVRKTRPHVVMPSAVSVDDVDDSKRELILKDVYMTSLSRDYVDRGDLSKVKTPLCGKYAPAMPFCFQKYKPNYVSPEWRKQSAEWDRRQNRSYCDTSKIFWLSRPSDDKFS